MRLSTLFFSAVMLMLAASCHTKNKANENLAPNVHKAIAREVIQSSNYTYLRVSEEGKDKWIAIARQEVEAGKSYYYEPSIEMTDFTSKELKRTFPSILFVSKFSNTPILAVGKSAKGSPGKQAPLAKTGIKVNRATDGITIAELYAAKDSYAGKSVKITGEVVKYNAQILGKNWLHIQDGTNSNGSFDLTITTTSESKVGDVVTVEGIVTLNKDFGAGYSYDVIIENGKLIP